MNNFIPDINKLNNDKSIDNKEDNYFNSLTTETFSRKENNSDVINLSELNKEKLEYERDDVKMNNGQFNNNFGQPESNQAPAFGGRFFPSLEDEPTNMNMMGGLNNGSSIPVVPATPEPMGIPTPPNINNNLIDLTDLSVDNEQHNPAMPNFGATPTPPVGDLVETLPSMEQSINIPTPNSMGVNDFNSAPNSVGETPNIGMNPMPSLESLQNNNQPVAPSTEPVSMDILNADFGAPQPMPNFDPIQQPAMGPQQPMPNFGAPPVMPPMPEPMGIPTPSLDINMPQNGGIGAPMGVPNMEIPQSMPNFGVAPTMTPMSEPMGILTPLVDINMPQSGGFGEPMTIPNIDTNVSIPSFDNNVSIPNVETNTVSTKDVTPVTNAIKSLVNSLTEFGYKINIIEDDLINVSKLTIEIEK